MAFCCTVGETNAVETFVASLIAPRFQGNGSVWVTVCLKHADKEYKKDSVETTL